MRLARTSLFFCLFSVTLLGFASSLQAQNYGMAGCGLGSMVPAWKNDIGQVLASTTNVATSSQTLGITSGTSNCTNDGIVKAEAAKQVFIHYNYSHIAMDVAKGEGERLEALSQLLGCPQSSKEIGAIAKKHYSFLFPIGEAQNPQLLLRRLRFLVSESPDLSQACSF